MFIPSWLVIVIIGIIGYFFYRNIINKSDFIPFSIGIYPKWGALLKDYNLIDDDGWKLLYEQIVNDDSPKYNVLRNGISFTVLMSDDNKELIYNNNRCKFHSKVDFRERIEDIKIPIEEYRGSLTNDPFLYSPKLWVKNGIFGYEIGITTPESFKKIIMAGDDNDLIKITTIPFGLFNLKRYRFGKMNSNQIEEQLSKHGLRKEEYSAKEIISDINLDIEYSLFHKYFFIGYSYI